ncbi:hypothetical protein [Streptomyces malaysiensis]|uniref:hypothetical protein n=1 Tax=Streptomyces malaysiensis TaxID=92644 RepID=UPI00115CE8AF|nr:hypothetical protein [Streptomyces malaysiensis]
MNVCTGGLFAMGAAARRAGRNASVAPWAIPPGPGAEPQFREGAVVERRLAGEPGAGACAGRAPFGAGGEGVNVCTGGLFAMGAAARRGRAERLGGTLGHPAGAWGGAPVSGRGG